MGYRGNSFGSVIKYKQSDGYAIPPAESTREKERERDGVQTVQTSTKKQLVAKNTISPRQLFSLNILLQQ